MLSRVDYIRKMELAISYAEELQDNFEIESDKWYEYEARIKALTACLFMIRDDDLSVIKTLLP
jgi:hypothetical protein